MPEINEFLDLHLDRLSHGTAPLKQDDQDFTIVDRLLRDTVLTNKS